MVPLRYGSGMRNKILEAWGMEKYVISTRVGAEGLDYHDGENILIADDAPALAHRTIEALRDRATRDRIRQCGREVITQQHHPDRLLNSTIQLLPTLYGKNSAVVIQCAS